MSQVRAAWSRWNLRNTVFGPVMLRNYVLFKDIHVKVK